MLMVLWRTNLLGWVNITETVGQFHRNIHMIHLLAGLLKKTLNRLGELPERNEYKIKYIVASISDVLLDGVERPIQRPQASDLQKSCYSGKKNS